MKEIGIYDNSNKIRQYLRDAYYDAGTLYVILVVD